MKDRTPHLIILLAVTAVALFAASIFWGSVSIPAGAVISILTGHDVPGHPSWSFIIMDSRLPQAVTAALSGAALSTAGLLLQTALRNPLAGPSILGIDSGASLGVAVVTMLTGALFGTVLAALVGALMVIGLLILLNRVLHSAIMLLIAGVMISYLCSSLISLLNYHASVEGLKTYVLWGLGSFMGVGSARLPFFAACIAVGLGGAALLVKPLNAMLLGDNYASNLGLNLRRTRLWLLLVTGLLTATVTAFCGPISFLGLAVPHIARMLLTSANHRRLMPVTMLTGAILALACSLASTLPGESGVLPINVLTPLIGAPVVLYVILKLGKLQ